MSISSNRRSDNQHSERFPRHRSVRFSIDDAEMLAFIEQARRRELSDSQISQLLKRAGWATEDIEQAFIEVNQRIAGRPAPKPAIYRNELNTLLLYCLSFTALGIWTQAIGQAAFWLIDVATSAANINSSDAVLSSITGSIARLLVFYPLYLWTVQALRLGDRARLLTVRKSFAYITLITIGVAVLYTLTQLLTLTLQSKIDLAFVLKAGVVFIISGDLFRYYYRQVKS